MTNLTEHSVSLAELAQALSRLQGTITSVLKTSVNPYFHSKYADLDAVWEMCRKPLSENGLAVTQTTIEIDGRMYLETLLLHKSGEYLSCRYPLHPMKQNKEYGWTPSNDPQSLGSCITYARRYSMSAMLGVSADEDDDGNAASHEKERADVGGQPGTGSEHWCEKHQTDWFMRGSMRTFAHRPAIEGDKWCYEPVVPTPTTVARPTPTTVARPTPTTVARPTPTTVATPTPTTVARPTPPMAEEEPSTDDIPDIPTFDDTPLGALKREVYHAEMEWEDFEKSVLGMTWPEWVRLGGNTDTAHARWRRAQEVLHAKKA